jgi:hypothetical protein
MSKHTLISRFLVDVMRYVPNNPAILSTVYYIILVVYFKAVFLQKLYEESLTIDEKQYIQH